MTTTISRFSEGLTRFKEELTVLSDPEVEAHIFSKVALMIELAFVDGKRVGLEKGKNIAMEAMSCAFGLVGVDVKKEN